MSHTLRSLVTALAILAAAGLTQADTVTLKTGETLTGTSEGQADGKLTFVHPALGRLVIPMAQVQSVATDPGAEKAAKLDAAKATVAEAGLVVAEPEQVAIKPERWRLLPGWNSTFEAGFSGEAGNSENINIYLKFLTKQETDDTRASIGSTYFLNTDEGDRTTNELRVFGRHDWLMPESPWFWFAKGDGEMDEFESWDYRVTGHVGPGYELVNRDDLKINLLAGLGGSVELGGDGDDEIMPEALVGAELEWHPDARQTIVAHATYYPDLEAIDEDGRTVGGASWAWLLDEGNRLSLKLGVDAEYESETEGDADHLDLKAYGALVFDF